MSAPLKACTKCGRELPAEPPYFRRNHRARLGVTPRCRDCLIEYERQYDANRKAKKAAYRAAHRDENNAKWRARYRENKQLYAEQRFNSPQAVLFRKWRSVGCSVCGCSDYRVIQAHHVDPQSKDRNINRIKNLEEVRAELAKCVPLCANHHILIHFALRNGYAGRPLDELIRHLRGEFRGL